MSDETELGVAPTSHKGTDMKVVASLATLFHYAAELGKARQSGDAEKIKEAQRRHDDYMKICLEADELLTGMTHGDLY